MAQSGVSFAAPGVSGVPGGSDVRVLEVTGVLGVKMVRGDGSEIEGISLWDLSVGIGLTAEDREDGKARDRRVRRRNGRTAGDVGVCTRGDGTESRAEREVDDNVAGTAGGVSSGGRRARRGDLRTARVGEDLLLVGVAGNLDLIGVVDNLGLVGVLGTLGLVGVAAGETTDGGGGRVPSPALPGRARATDGLRTRNMVGREAVLGEQDDAGEEADFRDLTGLRGMMK